MKRILETKPIYPKNLDKDTTRLIQKLLRKDPHKRLGSKRDAEELKESPFFKELDFDALSKKHIRAPIIPQEKTPGCCCGYLCPREIVLSEPEYRPNYNLVEKELENFHRPALLQEID
ncbi:ribosomal protein S6 kinase alpha-5-like [Xenopus laevis]|uniref:Ribosomal protein S6 kinase alpha-5-like n=1 Tax=Xenopus laevis TaxID=8355 RepID=A0A8J1LGA3_XENLA|nr:ribosomal protein S6 kinase alpha-5-like [Xenopus laevis]